MERMKDQKKSSQAPSPGRMPRTKGNALVQACGGRKSQSGETSTMPSELNQWPVQLGLIHPHAPYLDGSDLLIAADCCAYAYGSFHKDFISGKITVIGCPKLDDRDSYVEKLTEMLKANEIRSITVTRMEVPCCSGIIGIVKKSMLNAEKLFIQRVYHWNGWTNCK